MEEGQSFKGNLIALCKQFFPFRVIPAGHAFASVFQRFSAYDTLNGLFCGFYLWLRKSNKKSTGLVYLKSFIKLSQMLNFNGRKDDANEDYILES